MDGLLADTNTLDGYWDQRLMRYDRVSYVKTLLAHCIGVGGSNAIDFPQTRERCRREKAAAWIFRTRLIGHLRAEDVRLLLGLGRPNCIGNLKNATQGIVPNVITSKSGN